MLGEWKTTLRLDGESYTLEPSEDITAYESFRLSQMLINCNSSGYFSENNVKFHIEKYNLMKHFIKESK